MSNFFSNYELVIDYTKTIWSLIVIKKWWDKKFALLFNSLKLRHNVIRQIKIFSKSLNTDKFINKS